MVSTIRPTTTQRVRGFLAEQGIAPRPWSTMDETYAALYRLMRARTRDDAFWKPLAGLLRDIVADTADGRRRLPARSAELLASWDIEGLTRDLRRALPGELEEAPSVRRFTSSLAAPALGGFLLLGLAAAGCDAADEADCSASQTTWAQGCSLECGTALHDAVDDNETLTTDEKSALCSCLASEPSDVQSSLSTIFEECDPESIAYVLEDFVAQCESEAGLEQTDSAVLNCVGGMAYKGVSFPS
jgi:hypothetical protein